MTIFIYKQTKSADHFLVGLRFLFGFVVHRIHEFNTWICFLVSYIQNHTIKLLILRENELNLGSKSSVRLVKKSLKVYLLKLVHNVLYARLSFWMARSKDGAAILEGKNGGIERAVLSCLADDLALIKSDTWAEYGNVYRRIGNAYRGKSLLTVSLAASAAVMVTEWILGFFV